LTVAHTEELILRIYDAFRRSDVEAVIQGWHPRGELKPLSADRSYRGHDELRLYLTKEVRQFAAADFRVYTVLEQKQLALVFGRYSARENGRAVDRGIFWIAEVEDGKMLSWEGFQNVGEAFTEFKQRLESSSRGRLSKAPPL
jgi:ketosteroid isomerase-like protein